MARILICHVPKDGSTARDLGSALMARGHFVSFDGEPDAPRADRSTRLRQFEGVIVLWTETSYQSAGLTQMARETLPLNLLIPVRSDDLAITRLPLMFRKLNMLSPRDADGLARLIARLSTAASSMKEIKEQTAKLDAEPRRPLPPIIPRAEAKVFVPPPAEPPPAGPPSAYASPASSPASASRAPLTDAIISAQHARHTARSPVHLDLPDVTGAAEDDVAVVSARREPVAPTPPPMIPPQLTPKAWEPARLKRSQHTEPPPPAAPPPIAAPPPEEAAPYSAIAIAEGLSLAIEAGLLLHYIPEAMWLGEPGEVEVRLDRDVLYRFFGHPGARGAGGALVETLSLSLYGTGDTFEIERLSERTLPVGRSAPPAGMMGFDRWRWLVTPRAAGTQDLVVRVSALMLDHHGVPAPVALPDRRFRVDVAARESSHVMSSLSGWVRR